MGRPAARLGDLHVCPMMSGPVPHVGGPLVCICEPTVLIGGLPAARVTDMLICVGGGLDVTATGSDTVLIGGLPAARMGDVTAHGGVIVAGCPTVLIGDGGDESDADSDDSDEDEDEDAEADEDGDDDEDTEASEQSQSVEPQEELHATAYSLDDPQAPAAVDVSDQVDPDPQLTNVPAATDAEASSTTLTGEVNDEEAAAANPASADDGGAAGGPYDQSAPPSSTMLTGSAQSNNAFGSVSMTAAGGQASPPDMPSGPKGSPFGGAPASTRLLKTGIQVDAEASPVLQGGVQKASLEAVLQRMGQGVLDGLNKGMQELADKDRNKLTGSASDFAKDRLTSPDAAGQAVETFGGKLGEGLQGTLSTVFKTIDITKDYREQLEEIVKRDEELKKYIKYNPNVDPYVLGDSLGRDLANAYRGTVGIFTGLQAPNAAKAEAEAAKLGAERTEAAEEAAKEALEHMGGAGHTPKPGGDL